MSLYLLFRFYVFLDVKVCFIFNKKSHIAYASGEVSQRLQSTFNHSLKIDIVEFYQSGGINEKRE